MRNASWRLSRVLLDGLLAWSMLAGGTSALLAANLLDQIKQRGVLLWGADAEGGAPYVYPDPQKPEQLIGFECELAEAVAAKLGVKARMVQNQWDQLVIIMVELTKVYGMLAMSTYDYIGLGLMTAGIYFALSYPASLFAAWLERRLHHDHR